MQILMVDDERELVSVQLDTPSHSPLTISRDLGRLQV